MLMMCRAVSVYRGSLTRGHTYDVLETDSFLRQYRLRDDRNRDRWYPFECFRAPCELVKIADVVFELDPSAEVPIEVELRLSDGSRRFLFVATPEMLRRCGDLLSETNVRVHIGNRNLIVASELSSDVVRALLVEVESQDMLEECSLPIEARAH